MSTATREPQQGVFGNLTVPRRSGLFGLTFLQSAALIPLVLLFIALIATGRFLVAFVLVGFTGLVILLMRVKVRDGRTVFGRVAVRWNQKRKERAKKDIYLAGPTGAGTPDGATRLPGLMARSELSEHLDAYGRPFGLIRLSSRDVHHYTVVFEAYPDGGSLIDPEQLESRVAHWANWLTQLGHDEGIRGAQVCIESSPDSGFRVRNLLETNRREGAPEFSDAVVNEILETHTVGAPQLVARLSVTFDGRRMDGGNKDRGVAEMAEEIGNKIPELTANLAGTGAGTVQVCTAQNIVDFTRVAYDPTVAPMVEEMQANGEGTGLSWEEAGPSFMVDGFDTLQHDRAFSRSWTMWQGPNGHFRSNALSRIVEPQADVLRKRVTLLYRPIPSARTSALVQQEQKDAVWAGSQSRYDARAAQRQAAAAKTAAEEAQGAGLERFGLIVTVSVRDKEELRFWDRQVPALLTPAKLRVRTALANQAVTFQAGMPLGLVLSDHMLIPESIRKGM